MAITTAPLPVQQRAWDTRLRILEAAVACLAEEGYAAATTSRIQARSGVSRGSLLHQFPSKDDLLIAAVQHLAAARTVDLEATSARAPGDVDAAVEALWDAHHGTLFSATTELWVAARNNPDLATALAPREHELGRAIREMTADVFGPELAGREGFADFVTVLLTSMRGAALTYTFAARDHTTDPNLSVWRGLARLYLGVEAPARRARRPTRAASARA